MSDFTFEWFSGTGKGGQHRNKHQNCCRCTHVPTGITANGTGSRSREANKKAALAVCAARVKRHFASDTPRYRASSERIRTYHAERNEVLDHASGERVPFNGGDWGSLIEARKLAVGAPA